MSCIKIKICDVRTLDALQICQENNVDFIGLHQIEPPITEENIAIFKKIVEKSGKIKTVLLSKKVPIEEIVSLLRKIPFDYVQLHRTFSAADIIEFKRQVLKNTGHNIGVIAVFEANHCKFEEVHEVSKYADFILFDSAYQGGTGVRIPQKVLKQIAQKCEGIKYFIAGGLNPENVGDVICTAKPYGVDVQTGLECAKHIKDPEKVRSFVNIVRSYEPSYAIRTPDLQLTGVDDWKPE